MLLPYLYNGKFSSYSLFGFSGNGLSAWQSFFILQGWLAFLLVPRFSVKLRSFTTNRTFTPMAETLFIPDTASRREIYQTLLPQVESLISGEPDLTANLANVAAALKQTFNFFWVGFYLVKDGQLVLGPFQGPVACTRIAFDKGVCGACYTRQETILVPDVEQFPGHIACSSASKSEIVVPGFRDGKVFLVLDVDSDQLDDFDEADREGLENLMRIVEKVF